MPVGLAFWWAGAALLVLLGVMLLRNQQAVIAGIVRFLEWQIGFVQSPRYRLLTRLLGWLLIANGAVWALSLTMGQPPFGGTS